MSIKFIDRLNNSTLIEVKEGDSIATALRNKHIPVNSVITILEGKPINENTIYDANNNYEVRLIEGYDIQSIIKKVYSNENYSEAYLKNRITFSKEGALIGEHIPMNCEEVSDMVEDNIAFTIENYRMIDKGDKILVGLSGGVDSSALLMALSTISKKMNFQIVAATFEDFDSDKSPTFKNAQNLASSLNIEHKLISAKIVEDTFNLNEPIKKILPQMMNTKYAHFAMYTDHHTTRRALEVYSKSIGAKKIVLGLHTTDLIAGLINSFTMGYNIADMFKRDIGNITYIYPLMFIPKKELHMYYYYKKNKFAVHSYPNEWELNPKDRNYYYYLADEIQGMFPGIENYLYEAHSWRLRRQKTLNFTNCKNCGSNILQQEYELVNNEYCDVCLCFKQLGYIKSGYMNND